MISISPISVTISPLDDKGSNIRVSFTNPSSKCYEISGQPLAENNRFQDSFSITNTLTHEEALYTGPTVKLKPTFTLMPSGETKSLEVRLKDLYQISPGYNSVIYSGSIDYKECGSISDTETGFLTSNRIDIKV